MNGKTKVLHNLILSQVIEDKLIFNIAFLLLLLQYFCLDFLSGHY